VFTGGVHGDEFEGPLALTDLARRLAGLTFRGQVTILPFVNAPALWAGTRTGPLDGVNLARIFPGQPEGTMSHRLARAIWSVVSEADALVDCHSGGVELCFAPVAGFYGATGAVTAQTAARSLEMARATGLPFLWHLPATPGVLSHEAAAAGIAVTGCEIGGRGAALPGDISLYLDAFLRILSHLGVIAPTAAPPLTASQRCVAGDWQLAPASGLFRTIAPLGADVACGDPCARIETPDGSVLAELAAAHDGVILAERSLARVREGDLAVFVAQVTG
jgi:predicted deacylase